MAKKETANQKPETAHRGRPKGSVNSPKLPAAGQEVFSVNAVAGKVTVEGPFKVTESGTKLVGGKPVTQVILGEDEKAQTLSKWDHLVTRNVAMRKVREALSG